jgi:hypothetical protein
MAMSNKEQQALEAVLERATVDQEFRQKLLADPRRSILDAFGVSIPTRFNVKFIEKEKGVDALIVLPDFRLPSGELSESELDNVAGGQGEPDDPTWFR